MQKGHPSVDVLAQRLLVTLSPRSVCHLFAACDQSILKVALAEERRALDLRARKTIRSITNSPLATVKSTISFPESGSCLMWSLPSIASSRCIRVNLSRLSEAPPRSCTCWGSWVACTRSPRAGFLYSNITELEITKPSQATCKVTKPTS